jgi:hypothetical protein
MSEWKDLDISWHDTSLIHCELCGQLIPKTAWVATVDGTEHTFCSPDCEKLYIEYWLPRYGQEARPS